jgi:hypothetical protein
VNLKMSVIAFTTHEAGIASLTGALPIRIATGQFAAFWVALAWDAFIVVDVKASAASCAAITVVFNAVRALIGKFGFV